MLLRKTHTRLLSRLIAGLFAVQIVVTGFCLLTTQAHAVPMTQMDSHQAVGMALHCSKSMMHLNAEHASPHHSGGCFHCDEPDQFVNVATADITPTDLVLFHVAMIPELEQSLTPEVSGLYQTPTGPPRSSSLLFTTTQRIRI